MTAGSSGIVAAARVTRSTMLSTPQGQRRPGKVLGNQALPLAMENYYEYPFEQRVSPSAERCGLLRPELRQCPSRAASHGRIANYVGEAPSSSATRLAVLLASSSGRGFAQSGA